MVLLNEFKAWPLSRQSLGQVPAEQPLGRALERGGASGAGKSGGIQGGRFAEQTALFPSARPGVAIGTAMIEAGPSLGPVCVSRREGGGRSCSSLNISCVLVESCKECRNYSLAGSVEPSSPAAVVPRAQQPPSEAGRVLPAWLGSELAPASSPPAPFCPKLAKQPACWGL